MEKSRKKTQGRKKIDIKMIEDESSRRITFSKRRSGLFKKASELSTLCGVNMAIVLLTNGGGKAHSFGSPSVNAVTTHYLNWASGSRGRGHAHHISDYQEAQINQLNRQFQLLSKKLDDEKSRGLKVGEFVPNHVNKLGLGELERLKTSLEKLREKVRLHVNELLDTSDVSSAQNMNNKEAITQTLTKIEILNSSVPDDWLKL